MKSKDLTSNFKVKDWKQDFRNMVVDSEIGSPQIDEKAKKVEVDLTAQCIQKLGNYWMVDVDKIESNVQIRKFQDKKKISLLMNSIKKRIKSRDNSAINPTRGLINPITVDFLTNSNRFILTTGSCRLMAYKKLKLKQIPCKVNIIDKEPEPAEVLIEQYRENENRDDLKPFEEALAVKMLVDKGLTQREIARQIGKTDTVISKLLSIGKLIEQLPEELKKFATLQVLTYSQWESLLRIEDAELVKIFILHPTKISEMRKYEKSKKPGGKTSKNMQTNDETKTTFQTPNPISVNTSKGEAKIKLRIDFPCAYTEQDIIHVLRCLIDEFDKFSVKKSE
jgi:ParB/RepB/Spo0J family partition protein